MNSKFLKFGLIAALALCMASCDDDSDTEEGGNGGKTPASTSCTVGQAGVCDGNDVRVCINGIWQTTNCPYGCANGVCQPKPADDPGTSTNVCTAGALRCSGNDLQVCSNNAWSKKETCKNGCDAAKKACKPDSTTEPQTGLKEGDSCDENTDAFCNGDSLLYCGCKDDACTAGIIKKFDCASEKMACKNTKLMGSTCVYNEVSTHCKADGDMLLFEEGSCTEYGAEDGTVAAVYCEKIDGQFYGIDVYADSVCVVDSELGSIAVACKDETNIGYVKCEQSCKMAEAQRADNDLGAVCDGKPVNAGNGGDELDYDPYDIMECDDYGCQVDSGKCSDVCTNDGKKYCYVSVSKKAFDCFDEELIALGKSLWYCGEEEITKKDNTKAKVDDVCKEEFPGTIGICNGGKPGCAKTCTKVGDSETACSAAADGALEMNVVCSDVDGKLVLDPDYKSAKICSSNACNDDQTACK